MLSAIDELSKESIRKKVWDFMEKNDLACFPRPVHGRIPNFKGSQEAAQKLLKLNIFKHATTLKVNPDKPQEPVRFLALDAKKELLVPLPRISSGLFRRIVPPLYASKQDLRVAASQQGLKQWGKPVGLDSKVKVDLVVLGSVAVSKEGYRIGKGEGFADLEFAMMMMMGAVNQDTIVASTVHDCQVFESLPEQLFEAHDVPIDFIITPSQVIEVKQRLPKPEGLIWNLLPESKFNQIPILKVIRETELRKGKDCRLKRDYSCTDNLNSSPVNTSIVNTLTTYAVQHNADDSNKNQEVSTRDALRRPHEIGSKNEIDLGSKHQTSQFVVRVSNVASNVRVRDLKTSLGHISVKPSNIIWRGQKGYADLYFTNPAGRSNISFTPTEKEINDTVASLQDLKLETSNGGALRIELVS